MPRGEDMISTGERSKARRTINGAARCHLAAVGALVALLRAGPASADEAQASSTRDPAAGESQPPSAHVQALLEEALLRYEDEDYEGALVLLRRLYAMDANPGVLYNLAATHAALGHCEEARSAYQLYLEQSRSETGRRDAQRQLEALGECPESTQDSTEEAAASGAALEVQAQPGVGEPSHATRVERGVGEPAKPPVFMEASPAPAAEDAPYLRALPDEPGPSATRVAAWVAIGAGGALALASAGFAYASARADESDEEQPLAQSGDAVNEVQANGRRYNALAWGFAGGAAALGASGLLLMAFEPAPSTAVGVAAPASGPLSLTLRHAF